MSLLLDNTKRARVVAIVFRVIVFLNIIALISGYLEYRLLDDIVNGRYISEDQAAASDLRQAFIGILQSFAYIVSIFAFLAWFYRAYKNLVLANVGKLKYSPGWTIGGFFIPIGNLIIPYQVMIEVWKGSHVLSDDSFKDLWKKIEVNSKIGWWWGMFIISNVVGRFSSRLSIKAETPEETITSTLITMATDFMNIPAAILAIYVVKDITKLQEKSRVAHRITSPTP